jgi:hypothetical protein
MCYKINGIGWKVEGRRCKISGIGFRVYGIRETIVKHIVQSSKLMLYDHLPYTFYPIP